MEHTAGRAGFDEWYRSVHPRLVAGMVLATGRYADATDAADEAMVRAFERWDHVSTMASPDGWVFTVAYNLLRSRARRRAVETRVLRRSLPIDTTMPAPAGEAWVLVSNLPPRQREMVVLRFVADLPENEIATILGVSRGTVAATLSSARRTLRGLLTDPAADADGETAARPTPGPGHGRNHDVTNRRRAGRFLEARR